MKNTKISILILLVFVPFLIECAGKPDPIDGAKGVLMMSGSSAWLSELGKLKSPAGILPTGTNFSASRIIYKDPTSFNEFFVFDNNISLILLSNNPVYFIRIDSEQFRFKLSNELAQINKGLSGTSKIQNSTTYFKAVGDNQVEIYFTPNELGYTSSGSNIYGIKDQNDTTYFDLWRLYEAAASVGLYTPSFDDQKINDDFYAQYLVGKRRLVLATTGSVANPGNYNQTSINLNFSAMIGGDLAITDNTLGPNDINFQNRYDLQRGFAAFFSLPLGNSKDSTMNYLSKRDGIVVIVRGNVTPFKDFFKSQGVDFGATPVTPVYCVVSPGDIVINEVGSQCNGGSYNYVELYNKKNCPASVSGWKLYRSSSCGASIWTGSWTATLSLAGNIPAQSTFLAVNNSYAPGSSCPAPDFVATASNDLTLGTNACLLLSSGGSAPNAITDSNVMDFVGWGTAPYFEGAAAATQMGGGANQCISRSSNGLDTNSNINDFVNEATKTCSPQNSGSGGCAGAPTVTNVVVTATNPSNGTIPYNTGTTDVSITGTNLGCVACPASVVRLNDLAGTSATTCAVISDTQMTATFPAGIRTNGNVGWSVQITNKAGTNSTSAVKFIPKAGLLISEVLTQTSITGTTGEYVEIYNPTSTSLDLSNISGNAVSFRRRTATGGTDAVLGSFTLVTTWVIPSHGFFLAVSSASAAEPYWTKRDAIFTAALGGNNMVYISLSSNLTNALDLVGWGAITDVNPGGGCEGGNANCTANVATNDQSIERKPAGGVGHATDTDNNLSDFNAPSGTLTYRGTVDAPQP